MATFLRVVLCVVFAILAVSNVFAQTETATVSGRVTDLTGAVVPGVGVELLSLERGTTRQTKTNHSGIYTFQGCQPGQYHITIRKDGFRRIEFVGLILNIQDHVEKNFQLQVGSVSESITVAGGAPLVNMEEATVSTVVDRGFVANMPLNGRSFQDLILLNPGVVTSSPQSRFGSIGEQGEFSVNGQRTEANYYTVDGASANVGTNSGILFDATSAGVSGSVPTSTALGTTHTLVSVDALEEFRVQSSTYSAEFGRNPGGQFSFTTRSGTSEWHGTAFDYFRNGAMDANNWFNGYFGQPQPELRQNDFGGTLGGPIHVPGLNGGARKTFFFFSYEGLRLVQPQAAIPNFVPDLATRASTPQPLQQVLNAFPIPNGPDFGNGFARFVSSWADPSEIDSSSIRVDHQASAGVRLFFRFSDTPSSSNNRQSQFASPSNNLKFTYQARTYTLGATALSSSGVYDEFRLNYSTNSNSVREIIDNFAGAKPVNLVQLQGLTSPYAAVNVSLFFDGQFTSLGQVPESGSQHQWNLVNTVGLSAGPHQIKLGVDYRRVSATARPFNPEIGFLYSSQSDVQSNNASFAFADSFAPAYPLYQNFAAFVTDDWKIRKRLSLSFGLRWEVDPAPGVTQGLKPYTVEGVDPSSITLAPQGTPLWRTTWFNFAPRVGGAFTLRDSPGWETVLRAGGGLFFDTGQQVGSAGFDGPGFMAQFAAPPGTGFPLPVGDTMPTIVNPPVTPYTSTVFAFPAHLQLPYTLQWSAGIEQAFGGSQALTISYVGSHAGRLIGQSLTQGGNLNSNFEDGLAVYRSSQTADYNSLQTQFQRRVTRGLHALLSYTWSHSIDYGSVNTMFFGVRGNSDFDVRHNFSGALSYELPNLFHSSLVRALLNNWAMDGRMSARTAFPVPLNGDTMVDPVTGKTFNSGLDFDPGKPVYIYGSACAAVYANGMTCPGGRAINPAAFSVPPSTANGDAPRNFVRGFGDWQLDFALRRDFPLSESVKLQFRSEAFNVLNHPNFGAINSFYCTPGTDTGCTFGQARATLAQSLGILSPIYQRGGPRSLQLALRLTF